MSYRYRLIKDNREREIARYTLDELNCMGDFQLRDICVREKIMTQSAGIHPSGLDREALIELIFRYRGKQEEGLLDSFSQESAQMLKEMASRAFLAPEPLTLPFKIELIKDIPLMAEQEVLISHGFEGQRFLGILMDSQGDVKAVLEILGNRATLSPRRMSPDLDTGVCRDLQFVLFNASSSLRAVQAYNSQKWDMAGQRGLTAAKAILPVLSIVEAMESPEPLVIDFGASGASAASPGGEEILKVHFGGGEELCPSMAAVERCFQGEVTFRFGQDALNLIPMDGYGNSITFLHNLKLFLFEERTLSVRDRDGNGALFSSDFVLKQFFQWIISLAKAEHRRGYKRLRFLLPEKRGGMALERLRRILPEYDITSAQSESVNTVYRRMIEGIGDEEEGEQKELAFHCGGGSSSLTECLFYIENSQVAYEVKLREQYLNGDSGFGGNDLTYLILQYLKLKIIWEIEGRSEPLLEPWFADAYSYVDDYGGTKEIYSSFRKRYEEAEQRIPTRFGGVEETALMKKQNFYRLWFLAEGIKKAFFSQEPLNVIRLPDRWEGLCGVNACFPEGIREYRLTFELHREEIERVIAPEIYRLVKEFVEPLCDEGGILSGYRIRFTGLSCRIPVFRDALREFTVGRRARNGRGAPLDLKLRALEGAALREQLEKRGTVIPVITHVPDRVSYMVTVETYDGGAMRIISGSLPENGVFGYVRRHMATRTVEFSVCHLSGAMARKRVLFLDIHSFTETSYDDLFEKHPFLSQIQGDIDSIGNEEIRLFIFREENWDFSVLPVARMAGGLWVDPVRHFLFDDESADYFCGQY